MKQRIFIAGCGYVGRKLIERLPAATHISALSHSPAHARELEDLGVRVVQTDLDQARTRMSPGMLSYLAESRRLVNHRLHQELGVKLRYPNLEAGLRACKDDAE